MFSSTDYLKEGERWKSSCMCFNASLISYIDGAANSLEPRSVRDPITGVVHDPTLSNIWCSGGLDGITGPSQRRISCWEVICKQGKLPLAGNLTVACFLQTEGSERDLLVSRVYLGSLQPASEFAQFKDADHESYQGWARFRSSALAGISILTLALEELILTLSGTAPFTNTNEQGAWWSPASAPGARKSLTESLKLVLFRWRGQVFNSSSRIPTECRRREEGREREREHCPSSLLASEGEKFIKNEYQVCANLAASRKLKVGVGLWKGVWEETSPLWKHLLLEIIISFTFLTSDNHVFNCFKFTNVPYSGGAEGRASLFIAVST